MHFHKSIDRRYQAARYTNCDFGYTGHITQHSPVSGQSEIVLTLYRAYDPVHARWLSPDPIGEACKFPQK